MDRPAEEAVLGRWFYGAVDDDTTPETDQEAAAIRDELHDDTAPRPVRIDLDELNALFERNASKEEVFACLQGQAERAEAEQASLDDLRIGEPTETPRSTTNEPTEGNNDHAS